MLSRYPQYIVFSVDWKVQLWDICGIYGIQLWSDNCSFEFFHFLSSVGEKLVANFYSEVHFFKYDSISCEPHQVFLVYQPVIPSFVTVLATSRKMKQGIMFLLNPSVAYSTRSSICCAVTGLYINPNCTS